MATPRRSSDERLARAVREALSRSEPIRALDMDSLEIEVEGDIVRLRGTVATDVHKLMVGQLARGVRGVKEVVNELATEEELERKVATALASARTGINRGIAVNVVRAVAYLYGTVRSEDEIRKLEEAASAVPGIARAESRLHVLRPDAQVVLAWQASVEGRPIRTATSLEPGPETPGAEAEKPAAPASVAHREGSA